LADRQPPVIETRLAYCKWGLAGSLEDPHWEDRLLESARQQQQAAPGSEPVAVSYADWRSARAPQPDAVCSFVCRHQWSAFLIDTWNKDGKTLLDWLSVQEICRLCHRCHTAGIRVAIAGSLQRHHFVPLRDAGPDWFAVRGAACRAGMRGAAIDVGRVRDLARCVRTASVETSHGALSPGAPGDR